MSRRLFDSIDEFEITFDEEEEEELQVASQPLNDIDLTHLDKLRECPRCRKPLVPALAINGGESTFFLECPACGTLINTFKPLPHQAAFLSNPNKYKMIAGGYGSGKSYIMGNLPKGLADKGVDCAFVYYPDFVRMIKQMILETLKGVKLYFFNVSSISALAQI